MEKETCDGCGASDFHIKSEYGISYKHCTYCGRNIFVEQNKEFPLKDLIERWENELPIPCCEYSSDTIKAWKSYSKRAVK